MAFQNCTSQYSSPYIKSAIPSAPYSLQCGVRMSYVTMILNFFFNDITVPIGNAKGPAVIYPSTKPSSHPFWSCLAQLE